MRSEIQIVEAVGGLRFRLPNGHSICYCETAVTIKGGDLNLINASSIWVEKLCTICLRSSSIAYIWG
ncbi:hypothetical protein VNO80_08447 [Phaseolus coccineus]|uniref:Uncharacterized protein n=1 Tax=Phaseolus coccineus TaxID=3886 RepID=A0AAN9N9M7_PHACN